MFRIVFITIVLMVSTPLVFAETDLKPGEAELKTIHLYQWIDDNGALHITDGLEKVPKQYRDRATTLEQPQEDKGEPGRPEQRASQHGGYADTEGTSDDRKAEWQQRMKDAKSRLADLEQQYQELDRKRVDALGTWGGAAAGHREGQVEAERIEQEMMRMKAEISAAREQVEVVIPEEARKAGVPPGWLRE
jgi:hypothetical protein